VEHELATLDGEPPTDRALSRLTFAKRDAITGSTCSDPRPSPFTDSGLMAGDMSPHLIVRPEHAH
jgi:hypothetical protein